MIPSLYPSPVPFAITLVLATLFHARLLPCQETIPYDTCGQPAQCGDKNFHYPFWGLGRPQHCGHPSFQLTCQSNVPELVLESVNYWVLDIDSSTRTITIARDDLWSSICPQYLLNTTYDLTRFSDNSFGQENVSLYYGCEQNNISLAILPLVANYRFSCDVNGTGWSDGYFYRTSYVVGDIADFMAQCNNSITVPVNGSSAGNFASESDLRSALRDGFKLEWTANNDDCDRCVQSGGRCGSNATSPEVFACYCATGNFSLTCDRSGESVGSRGVTRKLIIGDSKSGGSSSSSSVGIVLGIVGGVIGVALVGLVIFVCRRRQRRAIKDGSPAQTETKAILTASGSSQTLTSSFTSSIPSFPSSKTSDTSKDFAKSTYFGAQVFTYEELEVATDNFNESRELGDGGFGTVYFGKLLDGREVAVKRLFENNFKRVEQFINEVRILTGLDHENLVKLHGWTSAVGLRIHSQWDSSRSSSWKTVGKF